MTEPFTIEMHEKARKDVYTDVLKRALRHFGDIFGLALYDEDAYVRAPDGSKVQVKAVPVNDKKQARQIVEAGNKPKAIDAPKHQHPPLDEQIKQAKLRAQKLRLAHNAQEWATLLETCKVTVINSAVDLAKINGHMTAIERGVVTTK